MKMNSRRNTAVWAILLTAVSLSSWSCDIFDEGIPENARVTLEGGGGGEVKLVTSNDFSVVLEDDGETRDIFLYSADTSSVTSSFNQRYSLGSGVRFFVAAFSEEPLPQAVTVKVFIGGEQRYNITSTLGEPGVEFVYTFR